MKVFGIFKLLFYKINGYNLQFNLNVFFHPQAKIIMERKKGNIVFGNNVCISKNVNVIVKDNGIIEFGDKLAILDNVHIEVGPNASIILSKETFINKDCKIVSMQKIKIGENVAIGPNVMFFDHDHVVKKDTKQDWSKFKSEKILIQDNVWIGANSIILKKAYVGHNSIIAAGSIINKKIAENSLCYNKRELECKKLN